ncbi:hypothetical protein AAEU28_10655 [Pseudoalteromonas sp. SS15]|uniref:hypothetical protein n=1 Tax=Pseudoalteromonas sp. SS15 TaxID=3139393 RepID=UPI003BAB155E
MINIKPIYIFTAAVFVLLSLLFYLGQESKISQAVELQSEQVAKRVSLDVSSLPLAEPLFNYAGNQQEVDIYIEQLNQQLDSLDSRVKVESISTIKPTDKVFLELFANYKTIYLVLIADRSHAKYTYIIVMLLTLANALLYRKVFRKHIENKVKKRAVSVETIKPKLVIDLYSKSLFIEGTNDIQSQLANKPLCFYLAMIEFSHAYPDLNLHLNKDVPAELLTIAEKYFHRLSVLGHTVRKRPNFSNSLEKTLSEIRAALDEILRESPELKAKLYPPKAHGEGSRSKLHSYGLKGLLDNDYEIRGK